MSEINSIANGTFTIGQTSATSCVAGPGISITQPTTGTVMIANDETELYYSPTNHNVANDAEFVMSESIWNFERVIITFAMYLLSIVTYCYLLQEVFLLF